MDCYTVFKRTTTHADVLAAIGAADLLRHLSPRIVNLEDRFEVQLDRPLQLVDLDCIEPGFSYLARTLKDRPRVAPERIVHRQAVSDTTDGIARPVSSDGRMYSILARMNAQSGPNKVVLRFAKATRDTWARSVWDALHGSPDFMPASPLVQLFNPHACRGYALLKPTGTDRGNKAKDRWAQPFLEWLRYRGYFEGSAGWFASGDFQLYCPIPANISYGDFVAVATAFRNLRLGGTGLKIDCRAVLGLTRLLIENSEALCEPRQLVAGVSVTRYKDMGRVHTVMGMDQLSIPDWFRLRTAQDAQLWRDTLDEHETVVRRLTDSHSDELALLKLYRGTFQMQREDAISQFVDFLRSYGVLLFRRRAQGHWLLPQLSLSTVAAIIAGDQRLQEIMENAGFRAVAGAVRGSTMGAQAARHAGKADHREVRFGLLTELVSSSLLSRQDFLKAVASFVSQFNLEASKRRRAGLRSRRIEDGEFAAFTTLLDQSQTVHLTASLLVGIATCFPGPAASQDAKYEASEAVAT